EEREIRFVVRLANLVVAAARCDCRNRKKLFCHEKRLLLSLKGCYTGQINSKLRLSARIDSGPFMGSKLKGQAVMKCSVWMILLLGVVATSTAAVVPQVSFNNNYQYVAENVGTARAYVVLSSSATSPVTVDY